MAGMRASAGSKAAVASNGRLSKDQILESIGRLSDWLEKNDYGGYETCAGWNAKYLRPLTFETKFLRTVLQQGVRRFPLNVRPLLGIPKDRSTKGMGYLAKGFMRLQQATGDKSCGDRTESALQWLVEHESTGYSGACWTITSTINRQVFICPKTCPRLFGPRSSATLFWTLMITSSGTTTCRSPRAAANISRVILRLIQKETRFASATFRLGKMRFIMPIRSVPASSPERILTLGTSHIDP
jgi:hypothetical protein